MAGAPQLSKAHVLFRWLIFFAIAYLTDCQSTGSSAISKLIDIRRYWTVTSQHQQHIRIGTPITLEQQYGDSHLNRYLYFGYYTYFEWLNEVRGGININGIYHPIELILVNDEASETVAADAAQMLVNDYQVGLFLAPYADSITRSIASVVHARGATMVAPVASSANVASGRPNIFSINSPADTWFESAFQMLSTQTPRPVRLAFVQEDHEANLKLCSFIPSLASKYSMQVVFSDTVERNANQTRIGSVVNQMANEAPDVVFGCKFETVCANVITAASSINWNPKAFVFTHCFLSTLFLSELKERGLYVMGTTPYDEGQTAPCTLTNATPSSFRQRYLADHPDAGLSVAAAAWTAGASMVHAIETAGTAQPDQVANVLRSMKAQTLYGLVEFDSHGFNKNIVKLAEYRAGNVWHLVAPPSLQRSSVVYPKPNWQEVACLDPSVLLSTVGYDSSGTTCVQCPLGKAGTPTNMSDGSTRRVCQECPVGKILRNLRCLSCTRGTFWCGTGWQPPHYGSWVAFQDTEEAMCSRPAGGECIVCPRGRYQDQNEQAVCKECTPGKFSSVLSQTICGNCTATLSPSGAIVSATFAAVNGTGTCHPCPQGAICNSDAQGLYSGYTNADGYYLVSNFEPTTSALPLGKLYKCPSGNGKACLARGLCYADDDGQVAMEGPFCGVCRPGYAKGNANELCAKCPTPARAWLETFSNQVVLFVISLTMFLNQYIKDPRVIPPTYNVMLRQFINYVHITTVVFPATPLATLGKQVVESSSTLQYIMAARAPRSSAVGAECYVRHVFPDMDIYKAWIITGFLVLPTWIAIDFLVFFMVRCICFACKVPPLEWFNLGTALTLNLFMVQPRLTKLFLIPFQCRFLDTSRMLIQTDALCDSAAVGGWQALAFIGVLGCSMGIPFGLMAVLYYHKRKGQLFSVKCLRMFGFVFQGLRPEWYYFECIHMVRKIIYQLAAYLPWFVPDSQDEDLENAMISMSLLCVTVFFMGLHLRCKPYDGRDFGILVKVESAMLWAILASCLSQIWLYKSESAWVFSVSRQHSRNDKLRDALLAVVVIAFHARFFGLILWGMFGSALRRKPWFIRWFGGHAEVQVSNDGIWTTGLSDNARKVLADTVRDTALQQFRNGFLSFQQLDDAMRRVCVQALYAQDRNRFNQNHPILGFFLGSIHLLRRLSKPFHTEVMRRTETVLHREGSMACQWIVDEFHPLNLDDMKHADGRSFSVEELYMEVIRLNWREDAHSHVTGLKALGRKFLGILRTQSLILDRTTTTDLNFTPWGAKGTLGSNASVEEGMRKWLARSRTSGRQRPKPPAPQPPPLLADLTNLKRQKFDSDFQALLDMREKIMLELEQKEQELAALKEDNGETHIALPVPLLPNMVSPDYSDRSDADQDPSSADETSMEEDVKEPKRVSEKSWESV